MPIFFFHVFYFGLVHTICLKNRQQEDVLFPFPRPQTAPKLQASLMIEKMNMSRTTALIVAAGSGTRFGSQIPKQYQDVGGTPILRRSVLAFLEHPHISDVQVVISPAHRELYDCTTQGLDLPPPVHGGATRQESVFLGLQALAKQSPQPDFVMIHDAARPLIDAATITDVRKALDATQGAIAAKPLVDTLKKASGDVIADTIERTNWLSAVSEVMISSALTSTVYGMFAYW